MLLLNYWIMGRECKWNEMYLKFVIWVKCLIGMWFKFELLYFEVFEVWFLLEFDVVFFFLVGLFFDDGMMVFLWFVCFFEVIEVDVFIYRGVFVGDLKVSFLGSLMFGFLGVVLIISLCICVGDCRILINLFSVFFMFFVVYVLV